MASPEQQPVPQSPERRNDLAEAAGERLKQLEQSGAERFDEASQEHAAEHARKQAELEAVFGKEQSTESKAGGEPSAAPVKPVTKQAKNAEYKKTMQSIQSQMSAPDRTFSKVIHNPAVEKMSNAASSTVARPNAILAGSFTAFIAVLGVYLFARWSGFELSGFETIAAFVIGWVVGLLFDLLRVAFLRRRAL